VDRLLRVVGVIVAAYFVIIFLRWVFRTVSDPIKYVHWGFSSFGFNLIETAIVIFFTLAIFALLIKKN